MDDSSVYSPGSLYEEQELCKERIQQAYRASRAQGTNTPLLKEELRLRIIAKRHQNGQPDIDTGSPEPKQVKLSAKDLLGREKRKEQNRRAATKSRYKKKIKVEEIQNEYAILVKSNNKLESKVVEQKEQLAKLKEQYSIHIQSGKCALNNGQPHSSDDSWLNQETQLCRLAQSPPSSVANSTSPCSRNTYSGASSCCTMLNPSDESHMQDNIDTDNSTTSTITYSDNTVSVFSSAYDFQDNSYIVPHQDCNQHIAPEVQHPILPVQIEVPDYHTYVLQTTTFDQRVFTGNSDQVFYEIPHVPSLTRDNDDELLSLLPMLSEYTRNPEEAL